MELNVKSADTVGRTLLLPSLHPPHSNGPKQNTDWRGVQTFIPIPKEEILHLI